MVITHTATLQISPGYTKSDWLDSHNIIKYCIIRLLIFFSSFCSYAIFFLTMLTSFKKLKKTCNSCLTNRQKKYQPKKLSTNIRKPLTSININNNTEQVYIDDTSLKTKNNNTEQDNDNF